MLWLVGHIWQPFLRFIAKNSTCKDVFGWSCSCNWRHWTLYAQQSRQCHERDQEHAWMKKPMNWPQSLSRWTHRRCSSQAWGTSASPAAQSGRSRDRTAVAYTYPEPYSAGTDSHWCCHTAESSWPSAPAQQIRNGALGCLWQACIHFWSCWESHTIFNRLTEKILSSKK